MMLTIDGSQGEGGGQVLRSSLALALVTGQGFLMERIRARRKRPGLLAQHLAAVKAAAEVGRAHLEGASLGSSRLAFTPAAIVPGEYRFQIGTAGSATLVLQTVLPALWLAPAASQMAIEGGTHNPLAPPADFLEKSYLPLVARMGPSVSVELVRPGFYPGGGGLLRCQSRPVPHLTSLELLERGPLRARRVRALVSRLPLHIPQRECSTIAERTGWDAADFHVEEVPNARGPGNVVLIELDFEQLTEVFVAFGRKGVPAETVAMEALGQAEAYLASPAPIDCHLADQLLLPLGIGAWQGTGGGRFRTTALSGHALTHLEILRQFLKIETRVEEESGGVVSITVTPK